MTGRPGEALEARLASHPFFQGLSHELLRAAAAHATERTYRQGEFLLREGGPADAFIAVVEGKVALEIFAADRVRLTVQTVGPGEVVGWSWLIPPHRWALDALAVKPTRVLAVDAHALLTRFAERPAEGYEFLRRLLPVVAGRLQAMRVQLLEADVL